MAALQEALAKRREILGAANDQGQSLGDVPGSGEDSGGSHTAGGAPRGVGVLGDDWPDTLTTKHNLASTYRAQGRSEVGEGNCASGGARLTAGDPGGQPPGHADDQAQPRVDVPGSQEDSGSDHTARLRNSESPCLASWKSENL